MYELLNSIDDMNRVEFDETLDIICPWILKNIQQENELELRHIVVSLLSIQVPEKYVEILHKLFTTDEQLYVAFARDRFPVLAHRRQQFVG